MMASASVSVPVIDLTMSEDEVLQEALQEFHQQLHHHFPQFLPTFTLIYDECKIEAIAQHEKVKALQNFMERIASLRPRPNPARIGDLVRKLCERVDEVIGEFQAKNRMNKAQCESYLSQRVNILCEEFKSCVFSKLIGNSEMDIKSFENFLRNLKSRTINYFENWNDGNNTSFTEQKDNLKKTLDQMQKEMLRKYKRCLEGTSVGNEKANAPTGPAPLEPDLELSTSNESLRIATNIFEDKEDMQGSRENSVVVIEEPEPSKKNATQVVEVVLNNSQPQPDDRAEEVPMETFGSSEAGQEQSAKVIPSMNKENFNRSTKSRNVTSKSGGIGQRQSQDLEVLLEIPRDPLAVINDNKAPAPAKSSKRRTTSTRPSRSSGPKEAEYPLVFRLASDRITMVSQVGKVRKQNEELSFPPVVGIDTGGHLFCGGDHDELNCQEHWYLADFLGENTPSKKRRISFKVCGEEVNRDRDLRLEFFLGYILKTMKDSAETSLKKKFNTAILTVPTWLSSLQRIQVKDALSVSGFTEAHLVNQESLVAYAYAHASTRLVEVQENARSEILVLSENFGIISGILYNWDNQCLTMIADEYEFRGTNLKLDSRERRRFVDGLCSSLSLEMGQSTMKKIALHVTNSKEWRETFRNVAAKYGYYSDETITTTSSSELFGASILWERKWYELSGVIQEYMSISVFPSRVEECTSSYFLTIPPRTKLPMRMEYEVPAKRFEDSKKQTILLEARSGEIVVIGEIEFKGSRDLLLHNANVFLLCFMITLESIITLDCVKMKKSGFVQTLPPENYEWTKGSMGEKEWEECRLTVMSIKQAEQIKRTTRTRRTTSSMLHADNRGSKTKRFDISIK